MNIYKVLIGSLLIYLLMVAIVFTLTLVSYGQEIAFPATIFFVVVGGVIYLWGLFSFMAYVASNQTEDD